MPTAPTKLQRWLDVIAFLAARRFPVATEDLWRGVPAYALGLEGTTTEKRSARRMFERDKDELRALGIPIETVEYSINHAERTSGYRLAKKDFHLPYLKLLREARPAPKVPAGSHFELTEAEAGAALGGLREMSALPAFPLSRAARSAFRKLAFDLDPDLGDQATVVYAIDPEAESSATALATLSAALQKKKTVTFDYRSMSADAPEERTVHGYGLLFQHGRWYLVAYDPGRGGVRMFRAGRMRDVSANSASPGTPDYEVPSDFTLSDFAGRKAWELGAKEQPAVEATVRFLFPRSLWADRNRHGTLIEEESDGAQRRSFTVHRREPFLRWVLSMAGDARIEGPDDLRTAFRALADRAMALHEGAPSDG